jgi:hypothetical protein
VSRFLKALAKMKLVELEDEDVPSAGAHDGDPADIDRILQETRAMMGDAGVPADAPEAEPAPAVPAVAVPGGATEIDEGVAFDALYQPLPESPFPAEKLLRLLDGLKAMDPTTRRTAVLAMDAADDSWTIHDALLDAKRKIETLQGRRSDLAQTVVNAEATAEADLTAQDAYKAQASETIRAQIADLEAMLEAELAKVAEEKAGIHARLQATRDAATREGARLEAEVDRLYTLHQTFGDLADDAD